MEDHSKKIERLNLVLQTMRDVSGLIIKEKNREQLLSGICHALIQHRGYYNAWAVFLDEEGKVIMSAEAGIGSKFPQLIEFMRGGHRLPCIDLALKEKDVVVTDEPSLACTGCLLAGDYHGRGALTVPFVLDGRVYGAMSLSIPREVTHDEDEKALLRDLAVDIAFGFRALELEEAKEENAKALVESEERFRDLLEKCPIGIFIVQDNQVVYQNPQQKELLGPLPRSFDLGTFEGLHPEDAEKVKIMCNNVANGKAKSLSADFRLCPVSQPDCHLGRKWIYCYASQIHYRGKDATLVNMMDITRSKELEHLVRIQDKMTSLGRVAAGIAHEIRNPLSGINIYLKTLEKLLERGIDPEKAQDILSHIQSASNKIESVVKRVIDFSRPNRPNFVLANINDAIEDAISLSAVTLRKSRISLEKKLQVDIPVCTLDKHLIEEVILNLITNAVEALRKSDGERKMEVNSFAETESIFVRIADSGPGIPLDLRDQVFDPFFSTKDGGTGIGLSLSHRIVVDHGGSLSVSTSKWGGAEFMIEIPCRKGGQKN
ncbi:MAG: PAS domain-containing sensor histidine kinase [Deltaproteobacteria bacterium]|nr:MAG: PAS domain-containing sensor histidine kinase [Deltaproteobacteria bacterium]